MREPLYACLYAAEFPAQALLRLRHGLRTRAVAVLAGQAPQERVCAANAAGRREGISDGMTRVEAESFGTVALLRRSEREEAEARAAMLACAGKYTPAIEDRSTEREAVCVLDLAGTERLFGEPLALAQRLAEELSGFGIHAAIALSANFHTAVALARSGPGVTRVAQGEEQQALAPLLLQVLPLTAQQEETLALWGIRTLGGLAALPEKALVARLGQAGKQLRALARGEHPHLFQAAEPGFTLRESYEFDSPVTVLESLLFVLSPMLDQLLLRARERALALASLTVVLHLEAGEEAGEEAAGKATGKATGKAIGAASKPAAREHIRTVRPALPAADRKLLLKLLQLELDAHPPAAAVLALTLAAEPGSESKVQLGLFMPQLPESSRLDVTLARLRALVGEAHVGSPHLQDTHAPDAFAVTRFVLQRVTAEPDRSPLAPMLRRVRPPTPLAMRLDEATPAGFWYAERQYQVVAAYGPWRSSGDWWSPAAWSCEQWDVFASSQAGLPPANRAASATTDQLCCLVTHDLFHKRWMLEAIYD